MLNSINPNFKTDPNDYSKVETVKLNSNELRGNLFSEFREYSSNDISWESEQIAKSHGIYLEFNRAKTGNKKDWIYMIRISLPGGGPITANHWNRLDKIADKYTIGPSDSYPNGRPNLRITTRQNIQLHWVRKKDVVIAIRKIAESGFFTINGCGDNTRNVIGCPLSHYSPIFNANEWAQKVGRYFALPTAAFIEVFEIDPSYLRTAGLLEARDPPGVGRFDYGKNQLNRKFKIGISAIHYDHENRRFIPDNCVELRTNDIGVAPIIEYDNDDGNDKITAINSSICRKEEEEKSFLHYKCKKPVVNKFQVYVGGSQGLQSGKPTISTLGEPFGIFTKDALLKGLDAIVRVHKEWGDRQNRHWARMKYLVKVKGIEWFREQARKIDNSIDFALPINDYDYGARNLHLGWIRQPDLIGCYDNENHDHNSSTYRNNTSSNDNKKLWSYGAFIENGRIIDESPNGNIKSMVRYLMNKYPNIRLFTSPNQHLLFTNIEEIYKEEFEKDMEKFNYGFRKRYYNNQKIPYSKLRMLSGACVGRDTCRLTYTDSEKFEPLLIDDLEDRWGHMQESIGITGCEKQCYRPATKTIGWIGTGFNLYELVLLGTEDGRNQGKPLTDPSTGEQYLHFVPRKEVVKVTDTLFEYYVKNRSKEEGEDKPGMMGYFLRRIEAKAIISYLKTNPNTAQLMKKTFKPSFAVD